MNKLAIAMAGAVLAAAAFAGIDEKTAHAELKALEGKALKAMRAKDETTLMGMLDDKFVWKHTGGRPSETKAQTAAGLKQYFAMVDTMDVKWTTKSFTCKGNTATVVTGEFMKATLKPGKDKKVHTMSGNSTMRETWVKGPKGWKSTMFEDMPGAKYMMDGKPFDPNKMGGGN